MGTRTKWIKFNNGTSHPCMAWGGAFREQSLAKIQCSDTVRGVSLVAIGQEALSEFAHTHWGVIPEGKDLSDTLGQQAVQLEDSELETPDWKNEFEGSYEEMKQRANQQDLGLVAVVHGQNGHGPKAETAVFGASQELAASALEAISQKMLAKADVELLQPESELSGLQTAA